MSVVKISFCTVCMNRLDHLKLTFLQNIRDANDYPNAEFVLLNYNSTDGLDDWVKETLAGLIETGKVVYHHTHVPHVFDHSHAKNVLFRLASGDVLCNVNADHFIGKGFAQFIAQSYRKNNAVIFTTVDLDRRKQPKRPPKDVFGKVCLRRADFYKVGGFDERMDGYGFEDIDFVNRIVLTGVKKVLLTNPRYLNFLPHTEADRYAMMTPPNNSRILVSYLSPARSAITFLDDDGTFRKGVLTDNRVRLAIETKGFSSSAASQFDYDLEEDDWTTGQWLNADNDLVLTCNGHSDVLKSDGDGRWLTGSTSAHALTNPEYVEQLLNFKSLYHNRRIMVKNLELKLNRTNATFGECPDLHFNTGNSWIKPGNG